MVMALPNAAAQPAPTSSSGPFLTDVETLRRRARSHMEEGAVTPSYGADRDAVV